MQLALSSVATRNFVTFVSVRLSVRLTVRLSVRLSVRLTVRLSVRLSFGVRCQLLTATLSPKIIRLFVTL